MKAFLLTLCASTWLFAQTTLQAESATLTSVTIESSLASYQGSGYAKMTDNGSIVFSFAPASAGYYHLDIRVATPSGNKNQTLVINGMVASSLVFPANDNWFTYDAGDHYLKAGANSIEIRKDWGWMLFDQITITPVAAPPPIDYSLVDASPIDPQADTSVQRVYQYLRSQYGQNILTGQTAYWDELIALAKKTPVVRAFDFQHYTQGYPYLWKDGGHTFGWEDDGTTQAAIDWYNATNKKGLVSFQWHWHSPSGGNVGTNTFYTNQTIFDVTKAIQNGTTENTLILRDIDSIATQLKRLQTAKVPVLWRPLHEAGGAWFWWGAKGSQATKALYDILYNRLVNTHGLHNLIWVWSTPEADWYPGNTKVDIIGYDSYPGEFQYGSQKSVFDQLYEIVEGKKLIAMTENGPIPDMDECVTADAMWSYFSSWSDMVASQNSSAHVESVFAHAKAITLDEVVYPQTPTLIPNRIHNLPFKLQIQYDLLGRIRTTR